MIRSKRCRAHDCYAFLCDWVREGERLGMEIEAIGGLTIERDAQDGLSQVFLRCRMDT